MSEFEAILETSAAAAVEIAASALTERGSAIPPCHNCGKPMIGAYCAVCGQERDTHRRSIWGLVKDLLEDIASFDSRILRTGWALLLRPGELARAFREGRTRRYVPALRLYFVVSLIFFLILGVSNIAIMQLVVMATPTKITWINGQAYVPNPAYDKDDARFVPKMIQMPKDKASEPGRHYEYSAKVYFFAPIGAYHVALSPEARARLSQAVFEDDNATSKPAAARKAKPDATESWILKHVFGGLQRLVADPAALNGSLTTWIPRVLFLLLPLYALLLASFYWRQRRKFYFVDHLIFSLTVHSFAFVALIAAAGLAQILDGGTVGWLFLAVVSLYLLLSMKHFYEQSWAWTVVKFGVISAFYSVFFLLPALAAVVTLGFLDI